MGIRRISSVLLTSVLVITVAGLISSVDSKSFDNIGFVKSAFAQNASNSSDLNGVLPNNSTDFGIPGDNTTNSSSMSGANTSQTSSTVPEFGNVAPIILVIAVISIVAISAKTRLKL